uniref:Uncharacterized protein n=1 Tax=Oryza meridionalis TaxID=40149 RepID=A0A0E0DNB4_9ORYZ
MKEGSQDVESKAKVHPLVQGDDEIKGEQPNTDAPLGDSDSLSAASNDNKRVSREDIELVQNLIERCLQLYMNRGEVVRTLSTRARIEPGFTTLVNNLPMGYPVLQQPGIPASVQPHVNSMSCGPPGCHVVNGIPAPGGYNPIRMSSGNGMTENEVPGTAHAGAMSSEMAVSPSSAMSSNHVSFTPDISGMDVDASTVNATFGDDLGNGGPLQIGPNGGDSSSLGQQIWDFSLSDLSADLTNLGDLAALENYSGNPFLPSDSDIFESPDDDIGMSN